MDVIKPFVVTDAALTSSNLVETAPADWSAATTYALNQTATLTTGLVKDVYRSLQAANLNHAPVATLGTWWALISRTYLPYNAATTYAKDDIVISTTTHRMYQSLQAANTNHPLLEPTGAVSAWWLDIGPTNRWAMFDQVSGTLSTSYDSNIDFTIQTGATDRINSVALLDLTASSVTISATYTGTPVYAATFSLTDYTGITDWYQYFFAPITAKNQLVVTDLPIYAGMVITVNIDGITGSRVSVGTAIVGLARDLGAASYGARFGIVDYSKKLTDDFGNTSVVERPYSKRATYSVTIRGDSYAAMTSQIDALQKLLASYRALPVLWRGADFEAATIYGFWKSFELELQFATYSILSLELEGLT